MSPHTLTLTQKTDQFALNQEVKCPNVRVSSLESSGLRGAAKQGTARPETAVRKGNRNRKSKKPRMKHPDSSDSATSNRKPRPPLQGLNQTSWSPSEASLSAFNVSYPAMVPAYPIYPPAPAAPAQVPCPDPPLSTGFVEGRTTQAPPSATPYAAPIVTPVVAWVLPNYIFPQIGQIGAAPRPAFFPEQTQTPAAYTAPQQTYAMQTQAPYVSQQVFSVQTAFPTQQPFQGRPAAYTPQQPFPVQTQFVAPAPYPAQPFPYSMNPEPPKALAVEPREGPASRSSTPASGPREPATSPTLFESRCSSPLQLNLLSMEEGQRSVERQDSMAPSAGAPGNNPAAAEKNMSVQHEQVQYTENL